MLAPGPGPGAPAALPWRVLGVGWGAEADEPRLRSRGETRVLADLGEEDCANRTLKTTHLSLRSPTLSLFRGVILGEIKGGGVQEAA